MDYSKTFAISAAGMAVERTRVEVAALNLANAHTTQAVGQTGYQPLRVVAHLQAAPAFAAHMAAGDAGALVPQVSVEAASVAPRWVHEPANPMADDKGFVAYPGVDPAAEMMSLMSATRADEANVAALNAARTLAMKALDIGGGNS